MQRHFYSLLTPHVIGNQEKLLYSRRIGDGRRCWGALAPIGQHYVRVRLSG